MASWPASGCAVTRSFKHFSDILQLQALQRSANRAFLQFAFSSMLSRNARSFGFISGAD